jgi:hypothetical protein
MPVSAATAGPGVRSDAADRPHLSRRNQYITLLLTTWTTLGLFLDVWSHGQFGNDSFFSPWHALFFPGFLAAAGHIAWPYVQSARGKTAGAPAVSDLSMAGVLLFLIGVIGDMVWHTVFGVERGVEAVMSPPHIIMLVGLVLISSLPFRAAWSADTGVEDPSFRDLLPALLSLALAMLIICLGAVYFWGFSSARFMNPLGLLRIAQDLGSTGAGESVVYEAAQQLGIASLLLTNLILLAPVLVMLRRWRLPFGSITMLFGVIAVLMAAVSGMFYPVLLASPITGGLCADWLNRRWRPSPHRVAELRAFAVVVPLVTWGLYFAGVHLTWTLAWSPLMWIGALMWTAAAGLGLSVVAVPGHSPAAP